MKREPSRQVRLNNAAAGCNRDESLMASAQKSKETVAQELVKRDQIQEGLVCVLSCVETCQTFGIRRDRESQRLNLAPQERKCLHLWCVFSSQGLENDS